VLVSHLENNDLLKNTQHGFRRGKSCLSNLLVFLDKVTQCVEDGDDINVVYLDFAKAFDKVPHQRLLLKLRDHSIGDNVVNWISSWPQATKSMHQWGTVNLEASMEWSPGGSVLGPVLFLIFITDIDLGIVNWILKFADNTKIFSKISNKTSSNTLQDDLTKLVQWSHDWQMEFSIQKCKVMHISHSNPGYK